MADNRAFQPVKSMGKEFTWQEVTTALVKQAGLHEGFWRVGLEFDLRAANVNMGTNSAPVQVPAAFLPVVKMNLRRVEVLDNLSVDAEVVNTQPRILTALH